MHLSGPSIYLNPLPFHISWLSREFIRFLNVEPVMKTRLLSADSLHSINNNGHSSSSLLSVVLLMTKTVCPLPGPRVYSCYLMWLELAQPASPQWANTGFLKLFLLKESAGAAGFCEFWHSGCLPGSLPLRYWVCCRRPSGFSDVSCLVPNDFFFLVLCYLSL